MVGQSEPASPPVVCVDDIAVLRLEGTTTLARAVDRVESAIGEARQQRCGGLLVVLTALSGLGAPSIAARHQMSRRWAAAADGRLRMAMVIRPEFADPDRFGEISAANFGLVGKGFLVEDEAIAWLRDTS